MVDLIEATKLSISSDQGELALLRLVQRRMDADKPAYSRDATPDAGETDVLQETLNLDGANQSVWLLKVPDFLYARWAAASASESAGTLKVYPAAEGSDEQRISIVLPPQLAAAQPVASTSTSAVTTDAIPSEYTLTINNAATQNMYAFGENNQRVPASLKRPREPFLAGAIKHECSVMPKLGGEYNKIIRDRQAKANQPKRRAMMLEEGQNGELNRLASGVASVQGAHKFKNFVRTGPKGRAADRAVRLPRPELERLLFGLFDEKAYWQLPDINGRVQQPIVYLKEVLADIANPVARGPYKDHFALKPGFKGQADRLEGEEGGAEEKIVDIDDEDIAFDEVA